jgi:hypothetical protein
MLSTKPPATPGGLDVSIYRDIQARDPMPEPLAYDLERILR